MKRESKNWGRFYFDLAHKLSPIINSYIQSKIKELKLPEKLERFLLELPKKREKKIIMRSTLCYLLYKAFGGEKNYSELVPLLAISEVSNYYAYLDNWIFDNKNNCNNDIEKIKMIVIASQILREIAQNCIEESEVSEDIKRKISAKLSEATKRCYEGQFRDLEMSIKNLGSFRSDEDFLEQYIRKSKLQSGSLYGFSGAIGAILANAEEKVVSICEDFTSLFGAGIHISNDLGDFAIATYNGSFKPYSDQLADIKNARLSFPIYYVLKSASEKEKKDLMLAVDKTQLSEKEVISVSQAILSSGAYGETKKILNRFRNDLKKKIKEFPDNEFRKAISSMLKTITHNKYLRDLKKLN